MRYLSNRSSGRMGYAVARAAEAAGASVTLVSGPVALAPPARVRVVEVVSAVQMHDSVLAEAKSCDIFISAAAVADYSSREKAPQKMKKQAADISLSLEKTPDILTAVAALAEPPFTVGFAAETENLARNAKQKLAGKNLDMVAANQVGDKLGFDSDQNALEVYWAGGSESLGTASKEFLARQLVEIIVARYREKTSKQPHKTAATEVSD